MEKFGVLLLKVLSIILLARILSPNDFGSYAVVSVVVSVACILVDSGLGGALIRKRNVSDLDYSTIFIFNVVVGFLIYSVIFLISPLVAAFYKNNDVEMILKILGIAIIIRSIGFIQITKLTKELNFRIQSVIFIISSIFSLIIACLMALGGMGYWALVGQQIADASFTVVGFLTCARYFPRLSFSVPIFKEHFNFGIKLMLSSVVDVLYSNIVTIMTGKSIGIEAAGLYSQANKVNEIFIGLVSTVVDKTSFPLLVRRVENKAEFLGYASGILRFSCFICFYLVAVFSSCAEFVVGFLLGERWRDSAWILHIISLSGYGMSVEVIYRSILKSHGRSDIILRLSVLKGLVFITTLSALAFWGLKYVLWGVVFLSGISALFSGYVVSKVTVYGFFCQLKDIFVFLCISLLVAIVISYAQSFYGYFSQYSLWISVLLSSVVYGLLCFLLKVKELFLIKEYISLRVMNFFSGRDDV